MIDLAYPSSSCSNFNGVVGDQLTILISPMTIGLVVMFFVMAKMRQLRPWEVIGSFTTSELWN